MEHHGHALCYNFKDDDKIKLNPNEPILSCKNYMNATELNALSEFTNDINFAELIFGITSLQRFKNGSWDPSNAETLFNYVYNQNGNNGIVSNIDYELGNEPELAKLNLSLFPDWDVK